jgi:hypothetical protein
VVKRGSESGSHDEPVQQLDGANLQGPEQGHGDEQYYEFNAWG